MKNKLLLMFSLAVGVSAQADKVTVGNFTSLSATQKANATEAVLSGTLSTSGNSDFRQLRDLAWQLQVLNLSNATCPDIPKNAMHSRHSLESLTLPRTVKTIGTQAFFSCDNLKGTLTIPTMVTSIGYAAFSGCEQVEEIALKTTKLTNLGSYAFAGCKAAKGEINLPSSLHTIRTAAFFRCSSITSLTLPSELLEIQDAAFFGCSSISGTINFGKYISNIGASAFEGCIGIEGNLVLPRAIQVIGASAFRGCTGFTGTVTLPESMVSLGKSAFYGCKGIEAVVIKNNIEIPTQAFGACTNLKSVTIESAVPPIANANAFKGLDCSTCKLYVPEGTAATYREAEVWKNFDIVENPLLSINKSTADNKAFVCARNGNLCISGATIGETLAVYSASGSLVMKQKMNGPALEEALPGNGVYIVSIGNKEYKVRN